MTDLTEEQRKEWEEKLKTMTPDEIAKLQKQQCIFCQIISGKVPSKKIYEDDSSVAILDINPATKGHVLLFPKDHYSIMSQVPDDVLGDLNLVSRNISQAMLRCLGASGTNMFVANGLVAGQRAQHFMIHIIPRKDSDKLLDLNEKLIDKDMQEKVRIAVGNKLNELLGVKKKIISVQEKLVEDSNDSEGSDQDNDAENGTDNEQEVKETKNQEEEKDNLAGNDDPDKDSEDENDGNEGSENDQLEEQEDIDEDYEKNEENLDKDNEEDKDVSLDDIANLFK
jgi:histidine triad (HIT) family protein